MIIYYINTIIDDGNIESSIEKKIYPSTELGRLDEVQTMQVDFTIL